MKTKLVRAGKSKPEIVRAIASALDKKELPALQPAAMCYVMSKQEYLSDHGRRWHPHLMFFVPSETAKSWGPHPRGSPVMAADDPEERATIFLVGVGKRVRWDAGTADCALIGNSMRTSDTFALQAFRTNRARSGS